MKPLDDVKVIDLSRVLAGPWAGQLLADLGAEVIKVERPGVGDDTREWGPPYAVSDQSGTPGESAYFLSANRGKLGIAVDFTTEAGRKVIEQLIAQADVVLENFRVGHLAKYGLDYASLAKVKPDIIYCSISGFGQTGPYALRPGYDFIVQGVGGLMSVTGAADGQPGGGPLKAGVALTDIMTGLYASSAVLAALHHRDRTGLGQHIDIALLDVQVATLANQALSYLVSGRNPERIGNDHPSIVPYRTFDALDEPFNIAVGNDSQFAKVCNILGLDSLATDPRFSSNAGRVRNRAELVPLLQVPLAKRPAAEWLCLLKTGGVPAGPINSIKAVFEDPQVRHRGTRIDLPHRTLGTAPGVACPLRFSQAEIGSEISAPVLGEHTIEILQDRLKLGQTEIDVLIAAGAVAAHTD